MDAWQAQDYGGGIDSAVPAQKPAPQVPALHAATRNVTGANHDIVIAPVCPANGESWTDHGKNHASMVITTSAPGLTTKPDMRKPSRYDAANPGFCIRSSNIKCVEW